MKAPSSRPIFHLRLLTSSRSIASHTFLVVSFITRCGSQIATISTTLSSGSSVGLAWNVSASITQAHSLGTDQQSTGARFISHYTLALLLHTLSASNSLGLRTHI